MCADMRADVCVAACRDMWKDMRQREEWMPYGLSCAQVMGPERPRRPVGSTCARTFDRRTTDGVQADCRPATDRLQTE